MVNPPFSNTCGVHVSDAIKYTAQVRLKQALERRRLEIGRARMNGARGIDEHSQRGRNV